MDLAQRIAWYCLLALVFLIPVVMGNLSAFGVSEPLFYDMFDGPKLFVLRALASVALAAWAWHIATRGGKIRFTPVDALIVAFLAWVTLSALFSIHVPTSILGKYRRYEGLLTFATYAAVYFLTLQFADRPSRIRRIAQALFWAGVVVSSLAVLQWMGADPTTWGQLTFETNRAFATYGNPDLLAGFLLFPLFVTLGLALTTESPWWRGAYWAGAILNSLALIASFVRGAWIGAVVGLILFAVLVWRHRPRLGVVDWTFSGAGILAVVVAILSSLSSSSEVTNFGSRLSSIAETNTGSAKTRFEIWDAALAAIRERPVFGYGPDTFRLIFPRFKPVEYVRDAGYLSVIDNAHNYPLQLAAGIGLPGLALLYGVFAWAAVRSGRVLFKRSEGGGALLFAGFWVAAAAYITHLMFGLSVIGSSVFLWIAIAVVLSPTARSKTVQPLRALGQAVGAAAVVAALVVVGYQGVQLYADHLFIRTLYVAGPERAALAEQAVKLSPNNDTYLSEIGLIHSDNFYALADAAMAAKQQGDPAALEAARANAKLSFDLAEAAIKSAIAFTPQEYDNYVFLAGLYSTAGDALGSADYYRKTIEISERGLELAPNGPGLIFQIGYAMNRLGDSKGAIERLNRARAMDPAYVEPGIALADLYHERKQDDLALSVLREIDAVSPDRPDVTSRMQALEAALAQ